jgi:hypothetical protein
LFLPEFAPFCGACSPTFVPAQTRCARHHHKKCLSPVAMLLMRPAARCRRSVHRSRSAVLGICGVARLHPHDGAHLASTSSLAQSSGTLNGPFKVAIGTKAVLGSLAARRPNSISRWLASSSNSQRSFAVSRAKPIASPLGQACVSLEQKRTLFGSRTALCRAPVKLDDKVGFCRCRGDTQIVVQACRGVVGLIDRAKCEPFQSRKR